MTEVESIRQAYDIARTPKVHKFGLSCAPVFAFVLAHNEAQARELIIRNMVSWDVEYLTYLGAKDLHELKPCVLLNQFCPF